MPSNQCSIRDDAISEKVRQPHVKQVFPYSSAPLNWILRETLPGLMICSGPLWVNSQFGKVHVVHVGYHNTTELHYEPNVSSFAYQRATHLDQGSESHTVTLGHYIPVFMHSPCTIWLAEPVRLAQSWPDQLLVKLPCPFFPCWAWLEVRSSIMWMVVKLVRQVQPSTGTCTCTCTGTHTCTCT